MDTRPVVSWQLLAGGASLAARLIRRAQVQSFRGRACKGRGAWRAQFVDVSRVGSLVARNLFGCGRRAFSKLRLERSAPPDASLGADLLCCDT